MFLQGQTDGAESSEGMMSDAECTPTLPGAKKDGVRRVSKGRQPRRIIEYSEPDSADDDPRSGRKGSKKTEVILENQWAQALLCVIKKGIC